MSRSPGDDCPPLTVEEWENSILNYNKARELIDRKRAEENAAFGREGLSDQGRKYLEKLSEPAQTDRLNVIMNRIRQKVRVELRPQCMDYFEAKTIVNELIRVRLARKNRVASFTPKQQEIMKDLLAYFIGDPASQYPLTKGIYLYGDIGVGKTFIFEIMQLFCEMADINNMKFVAIGAKGLVQDVADAKALTPIKQYFTGNLFLDDLGEEKQEVQLYGNIEMPVDLLISERYRIFENKGALTHATSNLPPLKLKDKYGSRIFDRIRDMMSPVLFPGDSKRH